MVIGLRSPTASTVAAEASSRIRDQPWPVPWSAQRTWAVEGAGGTGHLLDWQLVSAGERVLYMQPKLGARVRLLAAGT